MHKIPDIPTYKYSIAKKHYPESLMMQVSSILEHQAGWYTG